MKNKQLVLTRVEQIRQRINGIKYLINTNGNFDDIRKAFDETYEVLDSMENLVSIEDDPYRSNQLV